MTNHSLTRRKHFLILGEPEDAHAAYVAWALEAAGYRVVLLNSAHHNSPTTTTLYLDDLVDQFADQAWDNAEAAWSRRLSRIFSPARGAEEEDEFIVQQETLFTKWLIQMGESRVARWINRPTAAQTAENKFVQLKTARAHSIPVPRTLISARPERFREFLRREGTIIAKPLKPYSWADEEGSFTSTFTTLIDASRGDELSDEDIAQCVTIYQQRILKAADVRMVIMGSDIFAYKMLQTGEQYFDVRIGFYHKDHLRFEPLPVPEDLKKNITSFMQAMNVNFASADFALTSEGQLVFLDLNPSGQWLFLEQSSAEDGIGQKFCSFFVEGEVNPSATRQFPPFCEYQASDAWKSLERELEDHPATQPQPSGKET